MSISLVIMLGFVLVVAILVGSLLYDNGVISSKEFYDNTSINGIDVSGMNKTDAAQMISSKLLSSKDEVEIKLTYKDKEWILKGTDFEIGEDVTPEI